jgi:hypothetical protein
VHQFVNPLLAQHLLQPRQCLHSHHLPSVLLHL